MNLKGYFSLFSDVAYKKITFLKEGDTVQWFIKYCNRLTK